jgi:hypothetical protein
MVLDWFCHGAGQKLRHTELAKEAMRSRLKKVKNATFTYSQAFQSLTMCMVNETEIAQREAAMSKKKWTTPKGFVYPAPKVGGCAVCVTAMGVL